MIVGLGNPGAEYRGTRHNVGFEAIDRIAARHHIKVARGRNRALVGKGRVAGHSVALVKPLTFMNLSGQAVAPLARELNIKPQRILVVADDLDLPVGKVKMKLKGSSGGHNGHKSLIASLRSEEYPRIKVGIGKGSQTIDHVLGPFSREERMEIDSVLDLVESAVEAVVTQDWDSGLRILERYFASGTGDG